MFIVGNLVFSEGPINEIRKPLLQGSTCTGQQEMMFFFSKDSLLFLVLGLITLSNSIATWDVENMICTNSCFWNEEGKNHVTNYMNCHSISVAVSIALQLACRCHGTTSCQALTIIIIVNLAVCYFLMCDELCMSCLRVIMVFVVSVCTWNILLCCLFCSFIIRLSIILGKKMCCVLYLINYVLFSDFCSSFSIPALFFTRPEHQHWYFFLVWSWPHLFCSC